MDRAFRAQELAAALPSARSDCCGLHIQFSPCRWQLPSNYYTVNLPGPTGGPTIQATFVDANPFIIAYNATTNKYHSPYYVAHVRLPFLCSTLPCSVL